MNSAVAHRLRAQPQWPGASVPASSPDAVGLLLPVYLEQPQWDPNHAKGLVAQDCTLCQLHKAKCACTRCRVCQRAVGTGTRHHCRKCWMPVCGDCWTRERVVNYSFPKMKVCDTCAVPVGLAFLSSQNMKHMGLYLLRAASDLPRRCVDTQCNGLSYKKKCTRCQLMPTVPTASHVERLVDISESSCCTLLSSVDDKCSRCRELLFRMKSIEADFARERMDFLQYGGDPSELLHPELFRTEGVFHEASDTRDTIEFLCALLASSVCYEYPAFPQTTLAMSDIPVSRCMNLLYYSQKYSLLEGPNNTMYIAFPGTHDARTAMTDLKLSRVVVMSTTKVNGGVLGNGATLHGGVTKLWEYKAHRGFYEESQKLLKDLPQGLIQRLIDKGHRVVLTGHSLGGALASLVALHHLQSGMCGRANNLRCITFGCPLIGNTQLRRIIERCGWTSVFHHVVFRSDIIPRGGCGAELPKAIKAHVEKRLSEIADSLQSWWTSKRGVGAAQPSTVDEAEQVSAMELAVQSEQAADEPAEVRDPSRSKRSLDCFGTYHFLFRYQSSAQRADGSVDVSTVLPYKSTSDADEAFSCLKGDQGLKTVFKDHLLDSYNQAMAMTLRRPSTNND